MSTELAESIAKALGVASENKSLKNEKLKIESRIAVVQKKRDRGFDMVLENKIGEQEYRARLNEWTLRSNA